MPEQGHIFMRVFWFFFFFFFFFAKRKRQKTNGVFCFSSHLWLRKSWQKESVPFRHGYARRSQGCRSLFMYLFREFFPKVCYLEKPWNCLAWEHVVASPYWTWKHWDTGIESEQLCSQFPLCFLMWILQSSAEETPASLYQAAAVLLHNGLVKVEEIYKHVSAKSGRVFVEMRFPWPPAILCIALVDGYMYHFCNSLRSFSLQACCISLYFLLQLSPSDDSVLRNHKQTLQKARQQARRTAISLQVKLFCIALFLSNYLSQWRTRFNQRKEVHTQLICSRLFFFFFQSKEEEPMDDQDLVSLLILHISRILCQKYVLVRWCVCCQVRDRCLFLFCMVWFWLVVPS